MANSWSIIIDELQDGTITFTPDLPQAAANQPLGVQKNDNVTWNNRTNRELALMSINPPNVFLADPIPAGQPSNPIFLVTASVTYSCVTPSQPQHSIVVVT
jgi:hypothetical protein